MVGKKRIFNDEIFGFDKEFERMRKEMEDLMEHMIGSMPNEDFERLTKPERSGIYGLSIRIGPDGKPIIREFGNITPQTLNKEKTFIKEEREPLVDVIEGKREITIIAEVPGINKNEIHVAGTGTQLEIKVANPKRKYHKVLELPCEVDFENATAKCNNGVLEIVLQKGARKKESRKISVS